MKEMVRSGTSIHKFGYLLGKFEGLYDIPRNHYSKKVSERPIEGCRW